jgi:hypothetical protein
MCYGLFAALTLRAALGRSTRYALLSRLRWNDEKLDESEFPLKFQLKDMHCCKSSSLTTNDGFHLTSS